LPFSLPLRAKSTILALTGGVGTGKSTVANLFAECGATIIDADQISHALTVPQAELTQKIVTHFGETYLNADGSLNRKQLRQKIFESGEDKKWLEDLLHPAIYQKIREALQSVNTAYAVVVIPLLFETGVPDFIDKIIVLDCNEASQIDRVVKRDHMTADEVKKIMRAQFPRHLRLQRADEVIINDGDITALKDKVALIHQKYS
jgi:dephospho-CoA kinase